MTSAPMSANTAPAHGAAIQLLSSTTRTSSIGATIVTTSSFACVTLAAANLLVGVASAR